MESSTMFVPVLPSTTHDNSLDGIPTFLFRVSDRDSNGKTSLTEVCSPIAVNPAQKGQDLYRMKRVDAAEHLNNHLQWKCRDSSCNLMSWTSSLLFTLQYALYRHRGLYTQRSLSDIMILVVDTRQFKRGVFARDLQVMESLQGLPEGAKELDNLYEVRSSGRYYNGEYLSQGRVPIDPKSSFQVSMQSLIDHGLFIIYPQLSHKSNWTYWAKPVKEIRSLIAESTECIAATDVENIVQVASVFGYLALPITIIMLGTIPRNLQGSHALVSQEIRKHYTEKEINGPLLKLSGWASEPREVKRSLDLADKLRAMNRSRMDDVVLHAQKKGKSKETKNEVEKLAEAIDRLDV